MNSRLVFAIGLGIYLVGSYLAIIVRPDALTVAYAAAVLYGVASGWTLTCMSTITAHYYGPAAFPQLNGVMTLLTSVFASPAGYIGGKIFDLYGSYTRAFELNCVIAAIGIVAVAFAVMPRPRSEVGAPTIHVPREPLVSTTEGLSAGQRIRRQRTKMKVNERCMEAFVFASSIGHICQ